MKQWKASAPAKINLTLDITGVRTDGYHELASCFHTLQLADELTLFLTKQESVFQEWCAQFSSARRIPFKVEPAESPYDIAGLFIIDGPICLEPAKNNLILRSLAIFMQRLSSKPHVIAEAHLVTKSKLFVGIHIDKNIPFEAGLGGGSADAAAILRVLNQIFAYPFELDELIDMGLLLGMDIPFSIIGGAAELKGVGFEVSPVDSTLKFPVLLFKPPQGMPTANAYTKLDAQTPQEQEEFRPQHEKFMTAFKQKKYRKAMGFGGNIFLAIIASEIPEIIEAQTFLKERGAVLTTLCGSGSCSFAVFTNRQVLYRAKRELAQKYPTWWIKATMLQPEPHKNYLKSE